MANTFTHTQTLSARSSGGTISKVVTRTGEAELSASLTVAIGASNVEYGVGWDVTLKSFMMMSDQDLDIYTNAASTGSPQEHIALKAGAPTRYVDAAGLTNPFAGDVTKIFITNGSGIAAQLDILALWTAIEP